MLHKEIKLLIPFLLKNQINSYNGYVAVPKRHPYYGSSYEDLYYIKVHGGLTFSDNCIPRNDETPLFLDGHTEVPDNYWILGFDTLHCEDMANPWSLDKCKKETMKLLEQCLKPK